MSNVGQNVGVRRCGLIRGGGGGRGLRRCRRMKEEILNVMLMDVIRIDEEQDANEEWMKTGDIMLVNHGN